MQIKASCSACGATGIYRGFAESKGVGVICCTCGGEGFTTKEEGDVAPNRRFAERKHRDDVERVHWSRGSFIGTGVGPTEHSVSYGEFLAGKRPLKENL